MREEDAKDLLMRMLDAAITAADPARVLTRHLPEKPAGRCIVVGLASQPPPWPARWNWPGPMSICPAWW